ncbi:MAG: acyl-CoA dehydrogenase family protein [candidate division Zixibacteria bacterium]|nr:acyl-CoA dehydrogenase family protein [candidate division Zixibacteria bacterium]
MIRFNVDDRQQPIRDMVREFAEKEIEPVAKELDQRPEPQKFPFDYYRKLAKAGFIGYPLPKEYGGLGKSSIEYTTLCEELCYWDAPTCLLAAVAVLATEPMCMFASEEQKKKYVPRCINGEIVPAFALTEPNAGSDASNQSTEARIEGDHYIINGEKIFIMHGDVATLYVLFGKISEAGVRDKISTWLVEDNGNNGIRKETLRQKMGMRAATTGRMWFKDVKVPLSALMGERNKGFRYAMATLDSARIGVAAQGVGIAERALQESINYAKKRQAFGAPIAKLQAIQWMIADMHCKVEAARGLTYRAAQLKDAGAKFGLEASTAKLYATEAAKFCCDRAMQIHAGYGYIGEFSIIEKLYRDQRITEIYEGTSEIQRLVIAGSLLRD